MNSLARVGDKTHGHCSIHRGDYDGKVIEGSGDFTDDDRGLAREFDRVQSDCGHYGVIRGGSSTVEINGFRAARITDPFDGDYVGTITGGSSDFDTE
jgi:uncharacterized Zn-binding protein involved in type VI secretion